MKTAPLFKENSPLAKKLHTMRTELLAQIAEQRGGVLSRAEVAIEHFSHSQDSTAQTYSARDLEFALNERETQELTAIDEALKRLHTGHYGQCVACSKPIDRSRLNVSPEASRCLACQEAFEKNTV